MEGGNGESTMSTYRKLITVSSIAAGVQFGWAMQLSLLTPYIQMLGVPHKWSSFVWLCGPISGLVVQPIVGYYSDASKCRFGKRRPFIVGGALLVVIAVMFIGFALDFGHMAGDSLDATVKGRAVAIFVVGFWILDVANNMLQGPCRAFLADICDGDVDRAKSANAFFSFFMGVGNILGYSAGSYGKLYTWMPFTTTVACDIYCANLKTFVLLAIVLLLSVTLFACLTVGEKVDNAVAVEGEAPASPLLFFVSLGKAVRHMKRPMWILLAVTCMNWIAWFPWLINSTDWMGKEVYGGKVKDPAFGLGVQAGSMGLMLNSIVLLFVSIAIVFVSAKANGAKILWAASNFAMAICFFMTLWVTKRAEATRHFNADGVALPPPTDIKNGALTIFSILGAPLAVTFSLPFAMASIYCMSTSGGPGQGLSLGVLNLAIVIPQMIVSTTSGGISSLFGGGNTPVFVFGAICALISAFMALFWLPSPPKDAKLTATTSTGH